MTEEQRKTRRARKIASYGLIFPGQSGVIHWLSLEDACRFTISSGAELEDALQKWQRKRGSARPLYLSIYTSQDIYYRD
jgi:hypothetical protein